MFEPDYEEKWSSFFSSRRINVDQSPLPFAIDTFQKYEEQEPGNPEHRNKKVWSAPPTYGKGKLFCSMNICFSPKGDQSRLATIVCGQSKRLSATEKEACNKNGLIST